MVLIVAIDLWGCVGNKSDKNIPFYLRTSGGRRSGRVFSDPNNNDNDFSRMESGVN